MADDLRWEHGQGMPPIMLTGGGGDIVSITRLEAAIRMDAQAARWELEIRTGELNLYDRKLMGAAPR
jgi:hypothetical protein